MPSVGWAGTPLLCTSEHQLRGRFRSRWEFCGWTRKQATSICRPFLQFGDRFFPLKSKIYLLKLMQCPQEVELHFHRCMRGILCPKQCDGRLPDARMFRLHFTLWLKFDTTVLRTWVSCKPLLAPLYWDLASVNESVWLLSGKLESSF